MKKLCAHVAWAISFSLALLAGSRPTSAQTRTVQPVLIELDRDMEAAAASLGASVIPSSR